MWRRVLVGGGLVMLLSLAGLELMSERVRVEQLPTTASSSGDALVDRGQDVLTVSGDFLNLELGSSPARGADGTAWLAEGDR